MITIVDYGLGNIRAISNVYRRLNIETKIASSPSDLSSASKIILPGVGAFDRAIELLDASGLRGELEKQVVINEVPVLGICVGMQIMADRSEEGVMPGLGWINGVVKKFETGKLNYKIRLPHMGWNNIDVIKDNLIVTSVDNMSKFYFLHSYHYECKEPQYIVAQTNYGIVFTSAINKNNIWGVQFHPEKSHDWGVMLLYNFAKL